MKNEVMRRASEIDAEYGPDVEEALSRWECTGAEGKGVTSAPWLSVAFVFARRLRDSWRTI